MSKKRKPIATWFVRTSNNAKFDLLGYVVERYKAALIKRMKHED